MEKILITVAILASCGISWTMCNECENTGSSFKLKLISQKNETGHWVTQVELQREKSVEPTHHGNDQLSVEIDQYTTVCERTGAVKIIAAITAPSAYPAPGYELFPGIGYYKFHTKSAVWDEARKICASEGSHLAIINSHAESEALRKLLKRYPKLEDVQHQGTAFLGFHDMGIEGQYFTMFGDPLNKTGFYRWTPGQPDNAGNNEDCGSILNDGGLNDLPCTGKHAFICEQELK